MKADLSVISGGADENGIGSKSWAKKVRARAKDLVSSIETNYMELAEILFKVWDTPEDGDRANQPIWMKWGFKSFRDYAEQELGLHYKKAERLRLIWYRLDVDLAELDQKWKKRLISLGWSKVRELCRADVLTLGNAKQWIEKAENMNYQTVEAAVRKFLDAKETAAMNKEIQKSGDPIAKSNKLAAEKTADELDEDDQDSSAPPAAKELDWANPEHFTSKVFTFTASQLESVKGALERAKELTNSNAGGHNLSLICLEFVATNDFTKASEEQRLRYVAKMEKLLGYKFIVVDPKTTDVLYGLGTLEKVAKS